MGLSSSKSKTTQNQTQTTSGTQTPITPDWLEDAAHSYVGRIEAFGEMDPNSFVAPASPLQQAAWANAIPAMSGWQGQSRAASQMAQSVGGRGPNLAGIGQQAAGGAVKGRAGGLQAPASEGGLVSGQGHVMPSGAQGYAAARTGTPIQAQAAQAFQFMNPYQNPYEPQVVNSTLDSFDRNSERLRAQQAAAAARSGAFGGSRMAITQAQTEGELARGRAATEAGLRSRGFETAAQLGGLDAGRAQEAGLFNAASGNQFMLDQAGRTDAASQFGAAAQNQMAQFNAGQADKADNRALQAAQLLGMQAGDHAGNARADLGLMAQLGEQQRGVEAAYAGAPLAQLQALGVLSGMTPYDILVGRQVNGTGTMNGTSVTKSSPSLFNQALALGNLFL